MRDLLTRKVLPVIGIGSLVLGGCGDDDGPTSDAGSDDAGALDSGGMDAGMLDAGNDAGSDAGPGDAAMPDATVGVDVSGIVTGLCEYYLACEEDFEYTLEECVTSYTEDYNGFVGDAVAADGPACAAALQVYMDCVGEIFAAAGEGTCTFPETYCEDEYTPVMAECPSLADE